MVTKKKTSYGAGSVQKLEHLESIRKRPTMYTRTLEDTTHLLREIADNSLDEIMNGNGTSMTIRVYKDGSYEVEDDGRGIPRGPMKDDPSQDALYVLLTTAHSGSKFGGSSTGYATATSGLNGVGASVVVGLSSEFKIVSKRDGAVWELGFKNQEPVLWDSKMQKAKAIKPHTVKKGKATKETGTITRWRPDVEIFHEGATTSVEHIRDYLKTVSYLIPKAKFMLEVEGQKKETFTSKNGLADLVDEKTETGAITDKIILTGSHDYEEKVPVDGKVQTVKRTANIDVILRWTDKDENQVYAFTNSIPNPQGGTHVAGAERALNKVFNKHIKNVKGFSTLEKKHKDAAKIIKEDSLTGLTMTISAMIPEPQFVGQVKDSLSSPAAQSAVYNVVNKGLDDWLNGKGSKKLHVTNLKKRIYDNLRIRLEANTKKEALKKASGLSSEKMPSKLADCRIHGLGSGSEMFIVEGDSAAGSLILNRNPDNQAILPLKGKPLNVHGAQLSKALSNSEVKDIIKAMGGGVGQNFDLDSCRLSRVVIASDADDDGYHISLLLFTLYWRFFRSFVEDGRLYVAKAPLFTSQLNKGERIFAIDEKERDKMNKKYKNPQWTRVKGLGEQDADSLTATVLDHETRNLIQVTVENAEFLSSQLDLFMGSSAEARRNFMFDDMKKFVDDLEEEVVHELDQPA